MREIVHLQAGQCGNQIGSKVSYIFNIDMLLNNLKIVSKIRRTSLFLFHPRFDGLDFADS